MKPVGVLYLLRLEGISFEILNAEQLLRMRIRDCLEQAKATVVSELTHQFDPQGITGIYVLKESHCAFHSWPELGVLTIDVFTCGPGFQIDKFKELISAFFETSIETSLGIER
jgi:S-adenosylmethionine decarboxylase